jgi:hypothetical protein
MGCGGAGCVRLEFVRLRRQTALEWNSGLQAKVLMDCGLSPFGTCAISPEFDSWGGFSRSPSIH